MRDDQPEFDAMHEDLNAALREQVRLLGGNKKVGPMLWPELPIEQAAGRLRDCLNPDRREKLSPEQLMLLVRIGCAAGVHTAMAFICFDTGYEATRPAVPEDQEAALQRTFIDAVQRLEAIQKQLQRVQVRRAA